MPATASKRKSKKSGTTRKGTRTFVSFVLDESGSMEVQRSAAISGTNEYVGGLKRDGSIAFTLTKFNTATVILHDAKPIKDVDDLTPETYRPDGNTALYDAVGDTIESVARKLGKDERALIVILTDGQENSSKRFTFAAVRDLIDAKQKEGNWTFVFLGAGQDAWAVGQSLGVPKGNTIKYEARNTRETMRAVACSSRMYAASDEVKCSSFAALDRGAWAAAGALSADQP